MGTGPVAIFRDHLREAVEQCDVLLALIGDEWFGVRDDETRRLDDPTDFVRIEIESALARGIPVVPVLMDKAGLPLEAELPETLRPLRYRAASELRSGQDLDAHFTRLVDGVAGLLDAPAPLPDPVGPPSPAPPTEPRRGIVRLRREGVAGMALAMHVAVDGERVGKLRYGGEMDVPLAPGRHQVAVSAFNARGAQCDVDVTAGDTIRLCATWHLAGLVSTRLSLGLDGSR